MHWTIHTAQENYTFLPKCSVILWKHKYWRKYIETRPTEKIRWKTQMFRFCTSSLEIYLTGSWVRTWELLMALIIWTHYCEQREKKTLITFLSERDCVGLWKVIVGKISSSRKHCSWQSNNIWLLIWNALNIFIRRGGTIPSLFVWFVGLFRFFLLFFQDQDLLTLCW